MVERLLEVIRIDFEHRKIGGKGRRGRVQYLNRKAAHTGRICGGRGQEYFQVFTVDDEVEEQGVCRMARRRRRGGGRGLEP